MGDDSLCSQIRQANCDRMARWNTNQRVAIRSERKGEKMTVQELIDLLKTFDPKLLVCYRCCSEYDLMEPKEIRILKLCEPRLDGWVADARPDKPTIEYVVFPGN